MHCAVYTSERDGCDGREQSRAEQPWDRGACVGGFIRERGVHGEGCCLAMLMLSP